MAVQWNDKFKIGHLDLDDERQRLFDLTNEFSAGKNVAVARAVVARLKRYANEHFAKEEHLMRASGYRDAAIHMGCHRVLASHVNNLLLSGLTAPGAPGARDNAQFVVKVASVLEMWIFNHFMSEDPKLRPAILKYADSLGKKPPASAFKR